jgi:WASH complex subunit 7
MSKMDALNDFNFDKALKNADLLLQGAKYANEITNSYTVLTIMSANMSKVMTKSSVLSLVHLVELLKAIQMTYHKKKDYLVINMQLILQELVTKVLSHVQAARVSLLLISLSLSLYLSLILKKRIMSDKKYSEKRLDILSGLVLAANALNGPS